MKVEPRPGLDAAQIRPPWARTKVLAMAGPSPSPGTRPEGASTR